MASIAVCRVPCAVINITRHRKPDADEVYYPKDAFQLLRLLARLPYDVLQKVSTRITNEVREVNRVVVDITSKHPINVTLSYRQADNAMVETLQDTVTSGTLTKVYRNIDISSAVGGNTALIGFTGGTGGKTATQNILSWSYSSTATQTTGAALSVPVFTPAGGYYPSSQTVTMANATAPITPPNNPVTIRASKRSG